MTTATIDSSTLTIETTDWQVAMASGNRSIRLRGLSPQMLTEEGEIIVSGDEGDQSAVRFDDSFAYYVMTERILKPLGLVNTDGSVKEKYITSQLIPSVIEYAKKENERESIQRRLELATRMSRFNGRTVDENIELLRAKTEVEV